MRDPDWYEGDGAWLRDDGWALVVKLLERSAETGFAPALVDLGDLLREDRFFDQNLPEAARLYHLAAEAGDPEAVGRLGRMLCAGEGVPKDESEGLKLLKVASMAGSAFARGCLALKHLRGEDVSINQANAIALLCSATKAGDEEAMGALGVVLIKTRPPSLTATASWLIDWLSRSAEAGSPNATGTLAMFNEFGLGTRVDLVSARRWYERGTRVGDRDSVISLARFHFFGLGGPVDKGAARMWLERVLGEDGAKDGLKWLSARDRPFPWSRTMPPLV
jgi:TPR repeat protein